MGEENENTGSENQDTAPGNQNAADTGGHTEEARGGSPDWISTLSPDVRARVDVSDYKSPDDLGVALINAEKKIGAKGVILPGENATDADWDKFWNELGRPDKAEGYDLGDFKPPEDLPWDEEAQGGALAAFHGLGLTNKQAQGVLDHYVDYINGEVDRQNKDAANAAAAAETALRRELGSAYDAKMDLANRVVAQFGGAELVEELKNNGQGRNPAMVKAFMAIGEAFGEDGPLGEGGGGGFAVTPAEAQAEIKKIESDPESGKALTDASHPNHAELLKRRSQLYKMAYPEQGKA